MYTAIAHRCREGEIEDNGQRLVDRARVANSQQQLESTAKEGEDGTSETVALPQNQTLRTVLLLVCARRAASVVSSSACRT